MRLGIHYSAQKTFTFFGFIMLKTKENGLSFINEDIFNSEENRNVKSIDFDQLKILDDIRYLHNDGNQFQVDLTYGNGQFYKGQKQPEFCLDIDPLQDHVINSCSTNTPFSDNQIQSVVFDPPFLTYVRAARGGNGNMVMSKRFSGYWRYDELEDHYKKTLLETSRILKKKGVMVFKCQDIIHNHKMHCTHANVILWAQKVGLRLKDLFVLGAKNRMPAPNRNGKQKHARIHHCYFLVFIKP